MPRRKKEADPAPRRTRGTGSIVVLKDGTIRARLPSNLDSKRSAREFRPGQMADAVAWLDGYLHPPAEPAAAPVTVKEWAETWLNVYVVPIRPPNTINWYRYALRELAPLYDLTLRDLRRSHLQGVVGVLVGRAVDAATVQNMAGVWRRCIEAAVDDELLDRNPARKLVIPTPSPRVVKRHVTAEEIAALWPKIVGHRFEAAFALLLGCGLRIGEVLGLHWEHVDLANHRAWIGPQWTNGHWRDQPKGRNPHWITLPPPVMSSLARHRAHQPDGTTLVMESPFDRWHSKRRRRSPEKQPWSSATIRLALTAIVDELRLDPLTPHAGRRGLVTALLDGGASPAIVAERVGHANAATTLKFYAGRSDGAREAADALVAQYLGGVPEQPIGTENAG